jgi:hypothetical protein
MKKRKAQLDGKKPEHEKLTWPGLKAEDHLSRVITKSVKERKEAKENEEWAENQIARVLDYVSPQTAIRLLCQVAHRQKKLTAGARKLLSDFLMRLRESVETPG